MSPDTTCTDKREKNKYKSEFSVIRSLLNLCIELTILKYTIQHSIFRLYLPDWTQWQLKTKQKPACLFSIEKNAGSL